MPRVHVVANRTAESPELLDALKSRAAKGDDPEFLLVVPASGHGLQKAADPDAARKESGEHLDHASQTFLTEGLRVETHLGDPDPLAAVQDAVNFGSFDEVIVSTLRGRSFEEKALAARALEREVLPLFESGTLEVPVADTFGLEDAAAAYSRFEAGAKCGKIVLLMGDGA